VPANLAAAMADALEHLPESGALSRELVDSGTLTASRQVLHEALAAAVDEAGEAVGIGCGRLLRGQATTAEVRARVTTLTGLLGLLERLAEEAQPGGGAAVHVDRLTGDEGSGR
jgi:hypothetical protein